MKTKEQIEARLARFRRELTYWQAVYAAAREKWIASEYEEFGSEIERSRETCETLKEKIGTLEWVLSK